MGEATLATNLRRVFPGHTVRVENSARPGTPDVAYQVRGDLGGAAGWLELKVAKASKTGKLQFHRFTADQVLFLHEWQRAGGKAAMLVRVDQGAGAREFMLICGSNMALLTQCRQGDATLAELRRAAAWRSFTLSPADGLALVLAL